MSERGLAIGASQQTSSDGVIKNNGGNVQVVDGQEVQLPSSQQAAGVDAPKDRPAELPLGYDTLADFVAAVEAGTYKPGQAPAQPAATDTTLENQPAGTDLAATVGTLSAEGQTILGAFTTEFATTGTLKPESQAAAIAAYDKLSPGDKASLIPVYMAGLQANQTGEVASFYDVVGGKDQYAAFATWAQTGLSAQEQQAYNEAIEKAPNVAKTLLSGFSARFKAQGNSAPRDITRQAPAGGALEGDTYKSMAQVVQDMNDGRYKTDQAFRDAVINKIDRSKSYLGG